MRPDQANNNTGQQGFNVADAAEGLSNLADSTAGQAESFVENIVNNNIGDIVHNNGGIGLDGFSGMSQSGYADMGISSDSMDPNTYGNYGDFSNVNVADSDLVRSGRSLYNNYNDGQDEMLDEGVTEYTEYNEYNQQGNEQQGDYMDQYEAQEAAEQMAQNMTPNPQTMTQKIIMAAITFVLIIIAFYIMGAIYRGFTQNRANVEQSDIVSESIDQIRGQGSSNEEEINQYIDDLINEAKSTEPQPDQADRPTPQQQQPDQQQSMQQPDQQQYTQQQDQQQSIQQQQPDQQLQSQPEQQQPQQSSQTIPEKPDKTQEGETNNITGISIPNKNNIVDFRTKTYTHVDAPKVIEGLDIDFQDGIYTPHYGTQYLIDPQRHILSIGYVEKVSSLKQENVKYTYDPTTEKIVVEAPDGSYWRIELNSVEQKLSCKDCGFCTIYYYPSAILKEIVAVELSSIESSYTYNEINYGQNESSDPNVKGGLQDVLNEATHSGNTDIYEER